jgi:hypothetical protein
VARSHLVTGAKVRLFINGKPFGRVTGFTWTSDTPKKAIYGVDSAQPYELAPTMTRCTGSLSVLKLGGDGGAEGAGVAAPYPDLSREKYFTLTLVEIRSDLILFRANRCSLVNQSWSVPVRGLVSGSFSFEAIEWDNEVSAKTNSALSR